MNPDHLLRLLAAALAKHEIDQDNDWYEGSATYFAALHKELQEVAEEIESGSSCRLEDELGDVLWDYLNLLLGLQTEGRIDAAHVVRRAMDKYEERIEAIRSGEGWARVKERQRRRLADEHRRQSSPES
jgi:NTP pyrophosphatase (non-canonical NTP hydrolase)